MEAPVIQQATPADIEQNKVMAILAYILFLIPLLAAKDSPFAKFHTNQGLLVFILGMVSCVIGPFIPFIGLLIWLVGSLAALVFTVMGIINAAKGEMKPLPLIGAYQLIK
jgi:uncharacterized membrane protein